MGKKKKFKGVSKLNKQKPSNANTTLNEHFGIREGGDMHIGKHYVSETLNPDASVVKLNLNSDKPVEVIHAGDKLVVSNSLKDTIGRIPEEGFNMNLRSPYDRTLSNLPSADFDMDILQGERMLSPGMLRLPGISKFLTSAQIEELHKGEFVQSGGFEKGMTLSKQDPFFYAVRGEPGGTVIANSKGSVLIPGIRIPLGSKFDYRL